MNWQEIREQVLEINDLQQNLLIKSNNQVIKEIICRGKKYCNDINFNIKTLNNAVLEHQINLTSYQLIIIEKITELSLDTSNQIIFKNMLKTEEAAKYIIELKEKYELANNCFNLIMDIEALSKVEYEATNKFETSEYAKKVKNENELFEKINDDFLNLDLEIYKNILINNQKEYINALNIDRKKNLLLQSLTLSYDRNAFEFFNEELLIEKLRRVNNYNINQSYLIRNFYHNYKNSLSLANKMIIINAPLQEIYNEFKIIYETDFFKQKIRKK